MDVDNLRSQFSGPLSPMIRPKCAMEMSEPFDSPPVQPSIRDGHLEPTRMAKLDSAVNRADCLSRQNDALAGALRVACDMLVAAGIGEYPLKFDALLVELGGRVGMERIGNFYEIKPRKNTMGS